MRLKRHREKPKKGKAPYGGSFRKGTPKAKKGDKTIPGKNTGYFRLDGASPIIQSAYASMYETGGPAKQILIRLAYDKMTRSWETYREEYKPGVGFIHRCDGEHCASERMPSGQIHDYMPGQMEAGTSPPCPYAEEPESKKGCKPRGELTFYLCDFPHDVSFRMKFTSINDVETITDELEAIEERYGNPARIPLILFRTQRIINKKISGKATLLPEYLVSIRVSDEYARKQKAIAGISSEQMRPIANQFDRPSLPGSSGTKPEKIVYKENSRYVDFLKYIFEIPYEKPMEEWDATLSAAETFALGLVADGVIPNGNYARNAVLEEVEAARVRYMGLRDSHSDPKSPYPRAEEAEVEVVETDDDAQVVDVDVVGEEAGEADE